MALCQEAALLTMQKDMQAPHVCILLFPVRRNVQWLTADQFSTAGSIRGVRHSGQLDEATDHPRGAQ